MDIEIKREEEWCKVGGGEEGVWEMKECLERENIKFGKNKKGFKRSTDSKKALSTTKNECQRIKAQHDDGGL